MLNVYKIFFRCGWPAQTGITVIAQTESIPHGWSNALGAKWHNNAGVIAARNKLAPLFGQSLIIESAILLKGDAAQRELERIDPETEVLKKKARKR